MTREEAVERVGRELAAARNARAAGNGGMVRVCARRAAGAALAYWLEANPRPFPQADAMGRLRAFAGESGVPAHVRAAAERLTARIGPDFTPAHDEDPLDDCAVLVRYCLDGV